MRNLLLFLFMASFSVVTAEQKANNANQPVNGNAFVQRALTYAQGHNEFTNLYFKEHEQEFVQLVKKGQSPKTLFIGCSDSRVLPELITSSRPGDLFVIRTAGNFVPDYYGSNIDGVSATLEYAVNVLGVTDIVVCGHSHCGAIQGLYQEKELSEKGLKMLQGWIKLGEKAKKLASLSCPNITKEQCLTLTEKLSVLVQLEHLLGFPFVKDRVKNNQLYLHGWHFAIETGTLEYFDPVTFNFLPLRLNGSKGT